MLYYYGIQTSKVWSPILIIADSNEKMLRNLSSVTRSYCIRSTSFNPKKLILRDNTKNIRFQSTSSASQTSSIKRSEVPIEFTLLKNDSIEGISNADTNIELDDIKFSLDNEHLVLNLTWLRDFCSCPLCMHQYSRQRLFTIKDFKKHKFEPSEVRLMRENGEDFSRASVAISWFDGHESSYSAPFLRYINGLTQTSKLDLRTPQKAVPLPEDDYYSPLPSHKGELKPWDVATIKSSLTSVEYLDLVDEMREFEVDSTFINANELDQMSTRRFDAIRKLTDDLVTYGLARIINVPRKEGQILNVARSLAYERPTGYGRIFNVVVEPNEDRNLAYSALEFDLHTDLPYRESSPGVQLLHCIKNSTIGGDSYFCDAFKAAEKLLQVSPRLFEVLVQFPVLFSVRDPYRRVKLRRRHPILKLDCFGNLDEVNISPFLLPPIGSKDDVKLYYLAMDKLTQFLQSKDLKLITKMSPGDLFIFNNRRILHGRSAYDASKSRRFLQGCYMDWDEITCLDEKVRSYAASNRTISSSK